MIRSLHHVQLAIPAGGEADAEAFYEGLLGIPRVRKPVNLEGRGGCWFRSDAVEIHLGVDRPFAPARKAHPAFLVGDLDLLRQRLVRAGVAVTIDEPLVSYDRFYANDPFGNRIEFLQATGSIDARPINGKLVRDLVPGLIEASGEKIRTRPLAHHELLPALRAKVDEELAEYDASEGAEEAAAEIADLIEVFYAVAGLRGVEPAQLDRIRESKAEARGRFKGGILLLSSEESRAAD